MKKTTLVFLCFSFLFASCVDQIDDCFRSTGSIRNEERPIGKFSSIDIDDRINVFLTFGKKDEYKMSVKAGKNLQDNISTELQGRELVIRNDNKCNWVRDLKKEIDIFLTVPDLDLITYRGSGEVKFLNKLQTDSFRLEVWNGSGNLYFDIEANYTALKINTGSADVYSRGKAEQLVAFSNGLGSLKTQETLAKDVLAINTNVGLVTVHALELLKAEIRSNGNIEYYGSPLVDSEISGKGQLIPK